MGSIRERVLLLMRTLLAHRQNLARGDKLGTYCARRKISKKKTEEGHTQTEITPKREYTNTPCGGQEKNTQVQTTTRVETNQLDTKGSENPTALKVPPRT